MKVAAEYFVPHFVDGLLANGTAEDAIFVMELLRKQAQRIDAKLADPRHPWNRVDE